MPVKDRITQGGRIVKKKRGKWWRQAASPRYAKQKDRLSTVSLPMGYKKDIFAVFTCERLPKRSRIEVKKRKSIVLALFNKLEVVSIY